MKGWNLARGTSRDYVVLDPKGGIHSLARRIQGARLADVRKRFADPTPQKLPTTREAWRHQNGPHA